MHLSMHTLAAGARFGIMVKIFSTWLVKRPSGDCALIHASKQTGKHNEDRPSETEPLWLP